MEKNNNFPDISDKILQELSQAAWVARDKAIIFGNTKVGVALYTDDQKIFTGCNVEQIFRINDVHAEVNAISNMVTAGYKHFYVILIAAKRKKFTPCGSCMDWIMQFGGPNCTVAFQSNTSAEIITYRAKEIMPLYPE